MLSVAHLIGVEIVTSAFRHNLRSSKGRTVGFGPANVRSIRTQRTKLLTLKRKRDTMSLVGKNKENQKRLWREHYTRNRQKYIDKSRAYRNSVRDFVREYKNSRPCVDCGVQYPYYVMDFDHTGDDKLFNIANKINSLSTDSIKKEIAKCELVCGNCHRERTHQRLNNKT